MYFLNPSSASAELKLICFTVPTRKNFLLNHSSASAELKLTTSPFSLHEFYQANIGFAIF